MEMAPHEIKAAEVLIQLAIDEDTGKGDITTDSLVPPLKKRTATMVAKDNGVIAGLQVAEMVFRKFDPQLIWNPLVCDGDFVGKGSVIVKFSASYRALLTGERTALNFIQRMSGIATIAQQYVKALEGYSAKILDTRKTLPGFRMLDKYAVRAGGAENHRMGLFDMVMIKDNHIEIAGGIDNAVKTVRAKLGHSVPVEVETTSIEEVKQALSAGADIIMLDNMDIQTMEEAVHIVSGKARTEASGNMTLERIKKVASTGVDYISVGALTHSVIALDISQRIIAEDEPGH